VAIVRRYGFSAGSVGCDVMASKWTAPREEMDGAWKVVDVKSSISRLNSRRGLKWKNSKA